MRNPFISFVVGSSLLVGAASCADLKVLNPNDQDVDRILASADGVIALISGSFNTWFYGNYSYFSAGLALSNAAFQHNAPWANSGMEKYGRLPRISFINEISDAEYDCMTRPWFDSYRAIARAADGLRSLEHPSIQAELTADELARARAFGRFVQGIAHATIATVFDRGFIVDETTLLPDGSGTPVSPALVEYGEVMEAALGYFDDAIGLSSGAMWTFPEGWMQAEVTGSQLARIAHSMKARFRASLARTPAERESVNWTAVIADVDAGITEDYVGFYDSLDGWALDVLGYGTYSDWSQMAYFIYGMADQAGDFQAWEALSPGEKRHELPNGDPVLIVTPDNRFPEGSTVEEQRVHPGRYFGIVTAHEVGDTWKRAERGTWRWSWYKILRGREYWVLGRYNQPEIRLSEMRLLKAEGLFHKGDKGEAASIINETRVASGLNATDEVGINTSCVPKLPDGSCGDLWEMLKWEKRMENTFIGPLGVGWFWDSRGWGDLYKDTFVQLPVPCGEIQVLQLLPCDRDFGGPGGRWAAPTSTYAWSSEQGASSESPE